MVRVEAVAGQNLAFGRVLGRVGRLCRGLGPGRGVNFFWPFTLVLLCLAHKAWENHRLCTTHFHPFLRYVFGMSRVQLISFNVRRHPEKTNGIMFPPKIFLEIKARSDKPEKVPEKRREGVQGMSR